MPISRESGIDDEEILAIADGEYSEFSGPEQAAISYAVDYARSSVADETHAQVAEQFDDSDVVTISILASEYARVCSIIDVLGVEIDGEFVGWNLDGNVSR